MRLNHYSCKTEESYVGWYRRYVLWYGKRTRNLSDRM
jgi:hypothetical protein